MAAATSIPVAPRDRATRWKMHVLDAVGRGDLVVARPDDTIDGATGDASIPNPDEIKSMPVLTTATAEKSFVSFGTTEVDGAFVRLALDVLDDCREVVYARPLGSNAVEIGPRASALWGDSVDRALDAAHREAVVQTPAKIDMRAIHEASGVTWSLTPRCCDLLGKMISTRAALRHMDAAPSAPFVYRLALDGTDGAEPPPELWPPVGWALAKAYCVVIAVAVPLALALCTNMD